MEDHKMKIVMTTDTEGGVWNYSLELCRALIPHQVDVHLISLRKDPSAGQIREVKRLENTTLYPYPFKLEWMEKSTEDIDKTAKKVQQFCQIIDRKSTRLNSSHVAISYAVFCLKKKKKRETKISPTKRANEN